MKNLRSQFKQKSIHSKLLILSLKIWLTLKNKNPNPWFLLFRKIEIITLGVIFSLNFIPRSRNKFRSKNNLPTVLEWKIIETSSQIHFRRSKSKSKVRSLIVHTVFTQSVNCHACYVSNRWKPRRYPRRTPTPPSKSLSAIRGTCKRRPEGRGNDFLPSFQ